MDGTRLGRLSLAACLVVAGCSGPIAIAPGANVGEISSSLGQQPPVAVANSTQSSRLYQFEATVDPRLQTVKVDPVGFKTESTGIWVQAFNATWNAPIFSFDCAVFNYGPTELTNVQGVILSTTPGAPAVTMTGTSGTTGDGKPYYDYGTIPSFGSFSPGAQGSSPVPPWCVARHWQFSDPGAVPFKFSFTIRSGVADAGASKNAQPVINSLSPLVSPIMVGMTTTITAVASDPDGDPLTYSWSTPSGGMVAGSGNNVTFTAPSSPGVFPVQLTVSDGKGGQVTQQCNVGVTAGASDGQNPLGIAFGPGLSVPFTGGPGSAVGSLEIVPGAQIWHPGDQHGVSVRAWNQDHTQTVPAEVFWSLSGSSPNDDHGWIELVRGNSDISFCLRYGWARAGAALVTATTRSGVSSSAYLNVVETAPLVMYKYVNTDYQAANGPIDKTKSNTFNFIVQDGNGNYADPPTISISPPGTPYAMHIEGPAADNSRRIVVEVPPGGFTSAGTAAVTMQQFDDAGNSVSSTCTSGVH